MDGLVESVASAYARETTARFLRQHGAGLRAHLPGWHDGLADWVSREPSFEAAWAPVFGTLGALVTGAAPVTTVEAAVRLGLWLVETGQPMSWSGILPAPIQLRFQDRILDGVSAVDVRSTGSALRLAAETTRGSREDWFFRMPDGR